MLFPESSLNGRPSTLLIFNHFTKTIFCYFPPPKKNTRPILLLIAILLQVSLIVHSFVKNTIYANGAIVALFVKDDVMPYLKSPKP